MRSILKWKLIIIIIATTLIGKITALIVVVLLEVRAPVPPLVRNLPVPPVEVPHPLAQAHPATAQVGALGAHIATAALAFCWQDRGKVGE